ncbi:hypothetical protein ACFFRR_004440 [Megaselia abdita]
MRFGFTEALKDVHVLIPTAVKRGDNARLTCAYDLEEDSLYSIKWYKGNREFYRYTPRENPPMKVFPVAGLKVEEMNSNASSVMLAALDPSNSGKYRCEVSADAPSFHTNIVGGDLEVVDLPKNGPTIELHERIYSIGDILTANCSLSSTRRALANLTWIINNQTAHPQQTVKYPNYHDDILNEEVTIVGLKLVLQPKHFRFKSLLMVCRAQIFNIYENSTEKHVELDPSSNQIPFDDDVYHMGGGGYGRSSPFQDPEPDIKINHITAPDMSSSTASSAPPSPSHRMKLRTKDDIFSPVLLLLLILIINSISTVSTVAAVTPISSSSAHNQRTLLV